MNAIFVDRHVRTVPRFHSRRGKDTVCDADTGIMSVLVEGGWGYGMIRCDWVCEGWYEKYDVVYRYSYSAVP